MYDIISTGRISLNSFIIMLFRSLIKSSRAIKPASVQPVAPLRARFITSSPSASSPTSATKVKVAEGEAPLSKPPSDPNKLSVQDLTEGTYEKEPETSSEPFTTYSGTRSYVVNEPDTADSKYKIPTGAYHSTAPYEKSKDAKHEGEKGLSEESSTVARPLTARQVPGQGAGLMDKEGTEEGVDWVLESGSAADKK